MKPLIIFLVVMAIMGSMVSCSLSNTVADTLWPPLPFQEGNYVALKKEVAKARTFRCSRCSEQEAFPCEFRYDFLKGEIAQIESHEQLGFWLDQTAIFPRCSSCRIVHANKGAAWIDCSLLVRVEMQE